MMARKSLIAVAVAVAVVAGAFVAGAYLWGDYVAAGANGVEGDAGGRAPPASIGAATAASPAAESVAGQQSLASPAPAPLMHADGKNIRSPLAPGRYRMLVPFTDHGVYAGEGRWLPLLNGMKSAPAIDRDAPGPVPPVVAKIVDDTGLEWWEHADGSSTTTRWQFVTRYDPATGKQWSYWDASTVHNGRMPDQSILPGPPLADPPGASGGR